MRNATRCGQANLWDGPKQNVLSRMCVLYGFQLPLLAKRSHELQPSELKCNVSLTPLDDVNDCRQGVIQKHEHAPRTYTAELTSSNVCLRANRSVTDDGRDHPFDAMSYTSSQLQLQNKQIGAQKRYKCGGINLRLKSGYSREIIRTLDHQTRH